MESIATPATSAGIGHLEQDRGQVMDRSATLPWTIPVMLLGSTSIAVGILWDISWHMTIGRDTFWTPAHMAIYLGGVLAGICGGWMALRTTFGGSPESVGSSVRFWGFRAPFGAWVAIWGAIAMLTSAPFDDWWHNVYGLDVEILSPPHTVLAAGMIGIQVGTMLLVLAISNRRSYEPGPLPGPAAQLPGIAARFPGIAARLPGIAALYAAGVVVVMAAILLSEFSHPNEQHTALFYKVSCAIYPALLVAAARSSRLRWPATVTAASYMLIVASMVWILPRFAAQPLLGPINNPMDSMAPPAFPLLLVIPALGLDVLLRNRERLGGWKTALLAGAVFAVLFFAAQWLFSEFLLSPGARNAFFGGDQHWSYNTRFGDWRYDFWDLDEDPMTPAGMGVALLFAAASSGLGLWWGGWMARVRR